MADSRLHKLHEAGVSAWVDNLSRETVNGGELARLMKEDAIVGVTSNPSIFQKALASGEAYDDQLRECASQGLDEKETFIRLAQKDVSDACDLMLPVWERTKGVDGYVSIEVDPTLAYQTEETYDQSVRFHEEIDKPNLMVKIPATRAGLPAIEDMIAAGKSINVTLIFSLQRYKEVVEAHLRGLERLVAGGGDPSGVASVASFFVSRVDTEADKRLGSNDKLKGKLAIANARLAYEHFLKSYSGPRWEYLEGKGASKQRCLWASTSVKNPDYKDTMYVEELIAPDTVNTMPDETIQAFQDHGEVKPNSAAQGFDEARALIEQLAAAGVDYDDVVITLEEEGVQKFADSFDDLLAGIRAKRDQLVAA